MIGREGELRLVESFLDAAGPGARGLLLEGEPGIGKTTIWQAALDAAAGRGYAVLVTRPSEAEARLPFAGLNDLFGGLVDERLPGLPPPQQRSLDVALMRASADGEPMQPLALSLAVLELVRLAASGRPLALGIDDAQWLDESTAAVLRFALRRLESEPVVIVVAERDGASTDVPAIVADLPEGRVRRVPVRALDAGAIDRLLEESLGLQLAPSVLRRVQRLSGGNPFHALEVGRALRAGGVDPTTGHVPLPRSLTGLLQTRVASLPSAARDVAVHAAALAHPTPALLEAVLGPERTRDGLAEVREAGVLTSGEDPIRFAHPLLASEVSASLDDAGRRDVHRRLAAVVTEPEELARHLALAATGPDPDVADALDAAATHALGRGAPDAAADLSELAATLTPVAEQGRAGRMAAAGRYRLMAGDAGRARELLERALEEPAARTGPPRAELLFRLAGVRQLMDDFAASAELGREALRHAGDDVPLAVQIKLLLAGASYITGRDWSAGARHAFEAKDLAEQLDDPGILAATLGPCVTWCYATGRGYHRDLGRRASELEPWTARFRTLDLPEFDLAAIELAEGEVASAVARQRRLLERAEREGDYSSLPFLLANMALVDFLEGHPDLARTRIEQASRLARVTDQRAAQVHVLTYEARIAARLGDADRAREAGREAFALMAATGWRAGEWLMRGDLALLELSTGDPSAAIELVADALAPPEADGPQRRRWAQPVAVEALVALGRLDEARRVLDELEEHVRSHGSPRLSAEALRARARLSAAHGEVEAGDAAIVEAEAIHRRMEDRWEVARTLLVAGELHRRARRRAKARTALRESLETFALLGARRWAEQAREQLTRIDASREQGGLTPTQRTVAELVAGGLTNRQVADRLFMSPHTVEAHLSAIYRTLGIRSRADLRASMANGRVPVRDSEG